jgi:predicted nucleic acid-binding protein
MIEISPMEFRKEYFFFLSSRGIPAGILNACQIISFPPEREELYNYHYGIIQNGRFFHDMPFSQEDFMLAYLATELNAAVISYDHHLLNMIGFYLNYEAFWPEDILQMQEPRTFIMDCNILIEFQAQKSEHRSAIEQMFLESKHVFLIPEIILAEYQKLIQIKRGHLRMSPNNKQNKKSQLDQDEHPHIFPEDIEQYIDNYERIEPRRYQKERERDKDQFREEMKFKSHVDRKDFITKRYRALTKEIELNEHEV